MGGRFPQKMAPFEKAYIDRNKIKKNSHTYVTLK